MTHCSIRNRQKLFPKWMFGIYAFCTEKKLLVFFFTSVFLCLNDEMDQKGSNCHVRVPSCKLPERALSLFRTVKGQQHVMASIVSLHGFDFCYSRGIVMSHTNILISWVQFVIWRMKFIFIQIYGTAILWSPFACFIKRLIFLIFSQHCIMY